ncbi:MAG: hypothetical protein HUJ80_05380 [Firmicutes bacterium]|nr:hypothetical protein [Bacillota bacterium]
MKNEHEMRIQITKEQTEDGQLKLSQLFLIFQNIAGEHADLLGCGYDDLLPKGLFFAITNSRAEIRRMPKEGERLILRTCIGKVSHLFCPRYYRLYTEDEELLAESAVRWVLMDIQKRCAVNPADVKVSISGDRNPWQLQEASAVKPSATDRMEIYTVTEADLDVNGHMNNTRYFDAACGLLAEETQGLFLTHVAMEYRNELRLGQTMQISIGKQHDPSTQEDVFYLEGNTEEKSVFRMRLTYAGE